MSGYVIVDLQVTDPDKFAKYRELVPPIIEAYGGKYIIRGGEHEVVEGGWKPNRIVVIEFDSVADAKKFWDSDDYAPIKKMRHESADSNVIIVEGA